MWTPIDQCLRDSCRKHAAAVLGLVLFLSILPNNAHAEAPKSSTKPAPQPITFSHEQHCKAGAPCVICHQTAYSGLVAGMPSAAICMTCHRSVDSGSPEIRKIAAYARENKLIPWVRIYKIPDFVFFSHKKHADAGVSCAKCHGEICKSNVTAKQVNLTMTFCVQCHKLKHAPTGCNVCHTLSM